ncbi:M28 family peptidase [Gemmatimonadota bacterium]
MTTRWLTTALLLLLPLHLPAQQTSRDRFESASLAWDAGHYIEALEGLEGLLSGPGSDDLVEAIALLTGELYRVTEIAPNGQAVRWSPDGRYAVYETGTGSGVTTHIVEVAGGRVNPVARIPGSGVVFSPDGDQIAYLVTPQTPELTAARAEFSRQFQARDRAGFMRRRAELARIDAEHSQIVVTELRLGRERQIAPADLGIQSVMFGPAGEVVYFVGNVKGEAERSDIYSVPGATEPRRVTDGPGLKQNPRLVLGGTHLSFETGADSLGLVELSTGRTRFVRATSPVFSADGSSLAYVAQEGGESTVNVLSLEEGAQPVTVATVSYPLAQQTSRSCPVCPELTSTVLSPDGSRVAFQAMPREDWDLFLVGSDGSGETRLTREVQHDLFPYFLSETRLLSMKGEGRHRRAHLYDLETSEVTWLFHNNTVRTVAPEYEWAPSPDGNALLIVADRDGNTISPERGVYLMDLSQQVGRSEVLERVRANLVAERALREKGREMFSAMAEQVQEVVARTSTSRTFAYEEALSNFGSKYITEPGNQMAIEYLVEELRSFGYEPELQWFDARGTRTANVVATLKGTIDPDLVYAVSAHFDSSRRGPGADDNTSATAALLETARVMAGRPMSATIQFAFFTGEEAGLFGSREYVRRAVEGEVKMVGALNNDMVGWAENHRLDNTIRYSNAGIRDLQHAAAIFFSELITYDAKYYRSTDAAAYYEAYGDIVGGIGSYPILASPHYHQVHDVLETVNHQLVAEVSKATTAAIMLLASSPSRLTDLSVVQRGGSAEVRWTPAVESDVSGYIVAYGPESDPTMTILTVSEPRATLEGVAPGTVVAVKAVNDRDMQGWDWARAVVGR